MSHSSNGSEAFVAEVHLTSMSFELHVDCEIKNSMPIVISYRATCCAVHAKATN